MKTIKSVGGHLKHALLSAVAVGTCAVLLTGCATHVASYEKGPEAEKVNLYAKSLPTPPKGYAGLYFIRQVSVQGANLNKDLYVDGQFVGETFIGTYYYRLVKPGTHLLQTESSMGVNNLVGDFEEGKNYFYEQEIVYRPMVQGARLVKISENDAFKLLMNAVRAKDQDDKTKDLADANYAEGKGSIPAPLTGDNETEALQRLSDKAKEVLKTME